MNAIMFVFRRHYQFPISVDLSRPELTRETSLQLNLPTPRIFACHIDHQFRITAFIIYTIFPPQNLSVPSAVIHPGVVRSRPGSIVFNKCSWQPARSDKHLGNVKQHEMTTYGSRRRHQIASNRIFLIVKPGNFRKRVNLRPTLAGAS